MPPEAGFNHGGYALVTIHRAEATDDERALAGLIDALLDLAAVMPVLFPVHPRTVAALERGSHWPRLAGIAGLRLSEPLGYRRFLAAQAHARVVVTDSGGVQKEASIFGVPCLTLRDETEWMETVASGWNRLVGLHPHDLGQLALTARAPSTAPFALFGDGHAAERIAAVLGGSFNAEHDRQ